MRGQDSVAAEMLVLRIGRNVKFRIGGKNVYEASVVVAVAVARYTADEF